MQFDYRSLGISSRLQQLRVQLASRQKSSHGRCGKSASAAPAVGKAINLDELIEREYPADVRQRFRHGVVARPNPKWRSRTDKWRRCRPTHLVFGLSIFPISVTAVMEFGLITIIMGFPPLSVAWIR